MNLCYVFARRTISTTDFVGHGHLQKWFSAYAASKPYFSEPESGSTSFIPAARRLRRPPGITAKEFTSRRDNLVDRIRSANADKCEQFIVCLPSGRTSYMARDIPYVFRQDSDFRYLCGVTEPNSLLILHSLSATEYRTHLFVPETTEHDLTWHGPRVTIQQATHVSGIDSVRLTCHLENFLQQASKSLHKIPFGVYYEPISKYQSGNVESHFPCFFPKLDDWFGMRPSNCKVTGQVREFVQECRMIKSEPEVALIRCAANISASAIKTAITHTESGMSERELASFLEYESILAGGDRPGYPSVVASGPRAIVIHNIKYSEVMEDGDMVLVDSGSEVDGYCSDITRTWPVSGDFTPTQQTLYNIVHYVHMSILDTLRKRGNNYDRHITIQDLQKLMLDLLADQLKRHRILPLSTEPKQESAVVIKQFCAHIVSHYLGMDVHDCPDQPLSVNLREGMVFTVEPAIYIRASNTAVPEEYRGLGIRIEDMIYLGPNGPEVLSKDCPIDAKEITKLRCVGN